MADADKRRLTVTTVIFWVLFLYIIAALLWWFFSLMQQSQVLYNLEKLELEQSAYDTTSAAYKKAIFEIEDQRRRNTYKYVGEGSIFLLLIVVGAVYIYRSVRRQLQLQQQQQNFVMVVTHELKTPLSVARLNLETLKRYQQLDPQKRQKLIDTSLQETLRLDMLINNILISSQLDGKGYQPQKETLDFSALAASEVKNFSERYPGRPVHIHIVPDAELHGDALLLKLLISNLLENANKYSPKEKKISFSVQNERGITLQVRDEGTGIAEAEKEAVFQKFYRIGNEHTRTAKGTGLGLYICKKIATVHDASIQITDNMPHGSIFTVQFPA